MPLSGALLLEQTEESLVPRRYLSVESLAKVYQCGTVPDEPHHMVGPDPGAIN